MTTNIRVLNGVLKNAERRETGAALYDLGMFWGGVPVLNDG